MEIKKLCLGELEILCMGVKVTEERIAGAILSKAPNGDWISLTRLFEELIDRDWFVDELEKGDPIKFTPYVCSPSYTPDYKHMRKASAYGWDFDVHARCHPAEGDNWHSPRIDAEVEVEEIFFHGINLLPIEEQLGNLRETLALGIL